MHTSIETDVNIGMKKVETKKNIWYNILIIKCNRFIQMISY